MSYMSFLDSALATGFLDSVEYGENSINLSSGKDSLSVKLNSSAILFWGSKDPQNLKEYRGSFIESALSYLVASYFSTPKFVTSNINHTDYENVTIYPSLVVSGQVVFKDSRGKQYVTSSRNTPETTLAYYDVLVSSNQEHLILELPGITPYGKSPVTGSYDYVQYIESSLRDFRAFLPRPSLCSSTGVREYFDRLLSSANLEDIANVNHTMHSFFSPAEKITSKAGTSLAGEADYLFIKQSNQDLSLAVSSPSFFGSIKTDYLVKCNLNLLKDLLDSHGASYSALVSGITLKGKDAESLFKALASAQVQLVPEKAKPLKSTLSTYKMVGSSLLNELKAFGLEAVDGAFSSLKVVTYEV